MCHLSSPAAALWQLLQHQLWHWWQHRPLPLCMPQQPKRAAGSTCHPQALLTNYFHGTHTCSSTTFSKDSTVPGYSPAESRSPCALLTRYYHAPLVFPTITSTPLFQHRTRMLSLLFSCLHGQGPCSSTSCAAKGREREGKTSLFLQPHFSFL